MATNKKERDFQTYLLKKISREDEAVTVTSEPATRRRDDRHPRFEVWEYAPSGKYNKQRKLLKREPIYLSGPAWSIPLQASVVQTVYSLMSQLLGTDVVFDEWFEKWQNGFSSLINRPGTTPGLSTNFPVKTVQNKTGWREEIEARPQYLEWKHPTQKIGFRVIEYFPKGKLEPDNSVVFTGSDWQIINQTLNYEWQSSAPLSASRTFSSSPRVKGQPKIKIYFVEKSEDAEPGFQQLDSEISFRIIDKSEHPDSPLPRLTLADLKSYAVRIWEQFGLSRFHYKRGKETVSYIDKQHGVQSWLTVFDVAEGKEVYQRLCASANIEFKLSCLNSSKNADETNAYPVIPPTISVLGKKIISKRKRPVGTVWFKHALFESPLLKGPIVLVDDGGIKESKFDSDSELID